MRLRWALAVALIAFAFATRPAARQASVDPASLMTSPVVLMNGTRDVSQGTGFLFANTTSDGAPDTVFLVTNYHVVTGHAPGTTAARSGDRIRFSLHEDAEDLSKNRGIELKLYDAQDSPIWIASSEVPAADVVLVPLPRASYAGIRLFVFTEAHTRGDIRIRPTSGATLLGYPYGFYDMLHRLPVWKTGHIASEPSVDFEGRPVFLVDVSAFPGMSGSPVLAVANGIYESEDGVMRSGRVLKLLGIFSSVPVARQAGRVDTADPGSRPSTVETNLQLGYVWKAALIADLARGYRR